MRSASEENYNWLSTRDWKTTGNQNLAASDLVKEFPK
jgi:hypothetical protein